MPQCLDIYVNTYGHICNALYNDYTNRHGVTDKGLRVDCVKWRKVPRRVKTFPGYTNVIRLPPDVRTRISDSDTLYTMFTFKQSKQLDEVKKRTTLTLYNDFVFRAVSVHSSASKLSPNQVLSLTNFAYELLESAEHPFYVIKYAVVYIECVLRQEDRFINGHMAIVGLLFAMKFLYDEETCVHPDCLERLGITNLLVLENHYLKDTIFKFDFYLPFHNYDRAIMDAFMMFVPLSAMRRLQTHVKRQYHSKKVGAARVIQRCYRSYLLCNTTLTSRTEKTIRYLAGRWTTMKL